MRCCALIRSARAFFKFAAVVALVAIALLVYSRVQRYSVHIQKRFDLWADLSVGVYSVPTSFIHGLGHGPTMECRVLLKDCVA